LGYTVVPRGQGRKSVSEPADKLQASLGDSVAFEDHWIGLATASSDFLLKPFEAFEAFIVELFVTDVFFAFEFAFEQDQEVVGHANEEGLL